MLEYNIEKTNGSITCRTKTEIDNRKCFIKIILGTREDLMIKEFISSINVITLKEKSNPHLFTFNRRDYMAFILSRIIKYYKEDFRADGLPLNKWQIEDIKEKFGNFNDEYILFDYFDLPAISNKYFYAEEMYSNSKEISDFFKQSANRIINLSTIVSRLLDNTYSNNNGPKVVISLEIEPLKEKIEEFKTTFPYYKDESEETLLRYMKNNFAFSRLLGISICRFSNERVKKIKEA